MQFHHLKTELHQNNTMIMQIQGEKHINTQDKFLQIKINHPQVRHSEIVAQTVTHVNSDIEDTITRVAAQQKMITYSGVGKISWGIFITQFERLAERQ